MTNEIQPAKGKETAKAKGAKSVSALCQKYSIPATRILINRVLQNNMSDADLIKAVDTINNRAFGRPVAVKEVQHQHTVDIQVQHLTALKQRAQQRLDTDHADELKQSFAQAISHTVEEGGTRAPLSNKIYDDKPAATIDGTTGEVIDDDDTPPKPRRAIL